MTAENQIFSLPDREYDVYAVGNALVDTIVHTDDGFLNSHEIQKGVMTLVDDHRQKTVFEAVKKDDSHTIIQASGGSACNTAVALANLGSRCFYTGKVASDALGDFFSNDLKASGLAYHVAPGSEGQTGSCLVLTTPDSERSMQTNLGISTSLTREDIESSHIAQSKIVYIEGYLWDAPEPREACYRAIDDARQHGTRVALTFSDPFLVDRFRQSLHEIVDGSADIVFCNQEEAMIYAGTTDGDNALALIGKHAPLVFMTRGKDGVSVSLNEEVFHVAAPLIEPVDSTGAGDMFAAGALYGLTRGMTLQQSAEIAVNLASQLVCLDGPRLPKARLQEYLATLS